MMNSPKMPPRSPTTTAKLRNGEFKCFQCRKVTPSKDGDWYPWGGMQVHLCRGCERETAKNPSRLMG
jgi:hypothetical protein